MKQLMTDVLLAGSLQAFSQQLTTYTDSANQFSIGIPDGWKVDKELKEPGVALASFFKI